MIAEDILLEIDGTLDQLIKNAEVIQKVDVQDLNETEIDAFQKTQESLLHHLMHMDQYLIEKKNSLKLQDKRSANFKIQEKLLKFEKMKASYHQQFCKTQSRWLLSKRKTKKFLSC